MTAVGDLRPEEVGPETALLLVGELAPGGPAAHLVARCPGERRRVRFTGWPVTLDWGPAAGVDGWIFDPAGNSAEADVIVSDALPSRWAEIESWFGEGFRRRDVEVELAGAQAVTRWAVSALELVTDGPD